MVVDDAPGVRIPGWVATNAVPWPGHWEVLVDCGECLVQKALFPKPCPITLVELLALAEARVEGQEERV